MSLADPIRTPARSVVFTWAITLSAGVVGGLLAWLGGEATLDLIKAPKHPVNSKGMILLVADRWDETTAEARNAALASAILAGSVGTCLGVAGGLWGRSGRRAVGAGLLGFVAGALGVVAVGAAVLTPFNAYRYRNFDEAARDLLLPLLVHGSLGAVVGGAGGLAFGVGARLRAIRPRLLVKTALGGMIGAVIGTTAFELGGGVILAEFDGGMLIATTAVARLIGRLAVALGAAGGVAIALTDRRDHRPARDHSAGSATS